MDSRWCKIKGVNKRKRHTLHSMGVGSVFFVILFVLTKIFSTSLCPIKNIFGVSCFGCGMTRGFISILNFDFKSAFEYNVLSVPLFIGISFYCLFAVIDVVFDRDLIIDLEKLLSKKYMFLIYALVLIIATILNNKH